MRILITLLLIFLSAIVTNGQKEWTKNGGVNIARSSAAIPAFPRSVPEFRPVNITEDYWGNPLSENYENFVIRGSLRGSEGGGWAEIFDFPHTMNHCSDGIFMVRWRSANPAVLIESTVSYSAETARRGKIGKFGYMMGSNCEQPLFRFARKLRGNESNLVDVYYEAKLWQAAP